MIIPPTGTMMRPTIPTGICSTFCATQARFEVDMTIAKKVMLMPKEDPNTVTLWLPPEPVSLLATISSSVVSLLNHTGCKAFWGEAWLFFWNVIATPSTTMTGGRRQGPPKNFRLDYALSREQENKAGGKMYIQDKVEEYSDEIFNKLDNGAHIYFCGLKGYDTRYPGYSRPSPRPRALTT
jgi:ferredoxin--NADP+ reductase